MDITTLSTYGFSDAIWAMRNPMDSWAKSDSFYSPTENIDMAYHIGTKDKDLSLRLQKAGPEHCKHLRMIFVYADITAMRAWWNEFDTYRNGVEKISCSTMHKLMARHLTLNDFEYSEGNKDMLESIIAAINARMDNWKSLVDVNDEMAKDVWREVIELLPQSYKQKRTVMMSYAALRNIVRQRKGHKLKEWRQFIEWAESLPESWMIFE